MSSGSKFNPISLQVVREKMGNLIKVTGVLTTSCNLIKVPGVFVTSRKPTNVSVTSRKPTNVLVTPCNLIK